MTQDPTSLSGKVLVVGGASGQVGGAVVRYALEAGARVAIAVRKSWQVEKTTAQFGTKSVLVGCVPDVDGEAAAGFAKGANDALGPIDALLCCNGAFAASEIGRDSTGDLQDLMTANLFAVANLARAMVGSMKQRRLGSIVCVGSAGVGLGGAGVANYLASKAALHEWVRALAAELVGTGVRAAAIVPSTIDTPSNRAAMPGADTSQWVPMDVVVRAMFAAAFAPVGSGPLYPVPRSTS
jgi:NAD(P)-dependent dehydrogenase (short-subunit alcohol dehydrogenase family)